MKERPILFSAPMVRAILDVRKTVTRRVVKPQFQTTPVDVVDGAPSWDSPTNYAGEVQMNTQRGKPCPHGKPGDRLWVRETCLINDYREAAVPVDERADCEIHYRADGIPDFEGEEELIRWRPSIHMPRWACRILLEITDVRVERLQGISDAEIEREGIDLEALADGQDRYDMCHAGSGAEGRPTLRTAWRHLWESTGGDWDANPWVWVIEFKRVRP